MHFGERHDADMPGVYRYIAGGVAEDVVSEVFCWTSGS